MKYQIILNLQSVEYRYNTACLACLLNSVITRFGYIMQHYDYWCTLRPKHIGCHFADAMLELIFLNKEVFLYWNTNESCRQEFVIGSGSGLAPNGPLSEPMMA